VYPVVQEDPEACFDLERCLVAVDRAIAEWNEVPGAMPMFRDEPTGACGYSIDGHNVVTLFECFGEVHDGTIAQVSVTSLIGESTWGGTSSISSEEWMEVSSIVDVDIQFSSKVRFGDPVFCYCGPDVQEFFIDVESVILHELGHLLGIDESDDVGAVMFPGQAHCDTDRSLYIDDRQAKAALNGPVPLDLVALGSGSTTVTVLNSGNLGYSGSGAFWVGQGPGGQFGNGFEYPEGVQNWFEASLCLAKSSGPVSSDFREVAGQAQDNDFLSLSRLSSIGPSNPIVDGAAWLFDDSGAGENAYQVEVAASAHVMTAPLDYIQICYRLENRSGSMIDDLRVALVVDWDFAEGVLTNSTAPVEDLSAIEVSDQHSSNVGGMAV